MEQSSDAPRGRNYVSVPIEVIWVLTSSIGLLAVVLAGSKLAEYVPDNSPWLFMAAFAAPGAIAFGAFWLIVRRIRPEPPQD